MKKAEIPEDAPRWVTAVAAGEMYAVPAELDWESSLHLAHLIDGYTMCEILGLGDPFEFEDAQRQAALASGKWRGSAAELWTTLFLEHRRFHFQGTEPDRDEQAHLDRLCQQLAQAIREEA